MGLDMYLKQVDPNPRIRPEGYKEVLYWRKFNALHTWFVKNVQNDVDDCGYYPVPVEKLEELLGLLKQIVADNSKASKLLPTANGFFFGSTNFDSYYFKDVKSTAEDIEALLLNHDGEHYVYHSSW